MRCGLYRWPHRFVLPKGYRYYASRHRKKYKGLNQFGHLLFDLQNDPQQLHPIHDDVIESRMIALLIQLMKDNDAPPEQFQRLGLA